MVTFLPGPMGRLEKLTAISGNDLVLTRTVGDSELKEVTVEAVRTTIPLDQIFIRDISDFPPASGDTITLEAKSYIVLGSVNMGTTKIAIAAGSELGGLCSINDNLIYTGIGAFISGTNVSTCISNITLIVPSNVIGLIFEDTVGVEKTNTLIVDTIAFSGGTLLSSTNLKNVYVKDYSVLSADSNVFNLMGSQNGRLILRDGEIASFNTTAFNLNNAVFDIIDISSHDLPDVSGGKIAIDGVASSANLSTDGLGLIYNNRFVGAGTFLNTITVGDLKWKTYDNTNVADSQIFGQMAMVGNSTETTVDFINTWTKIEGTTVALAGNQRITMPESNNLTYVGREPTCGLLIITMSGRRDSGANQIDIDYTIFKNGTIMDTNVVTSQEMTNQVLQINLSAGVSLSENDEFEVYCRNLDDTTDILIVSMQTQLLGQL